MWHPERKTQFLELQISINWALHKITNGPWPKHWVEFTGKGSTQKIPLNASLVKVGNITWDSLMGSSFPTDAIYLIETIDLDGQGACPNKGIGQTCFWRPIGPNPPVPELSPIILTSAGLLGIFLLSRKYRSN